MTTIARAQAAIGQLLATQSVPPAPGNSTAGDGGAWLVSVRCAPASRSQKHDEIELLGDSLLTVLDKHEPVVSVDGRGLLLTVSVNSSAGAAVPMAIALVWNGLEECSAEGAVVIIGAWQVSEDALRTLVSPDQSLMLLNASDCARELEISRQRVAQLIDANDFPEPCGVMGARPVWRFDDIRIFKSRRRGARN